MFVKRILNTRGTQIELNSVLHLIVTIVWHQIRDKDADFILDFALQNFQPLALQCLGEWIELKSTCPEAEPLDEKYYRSLPFINKA